MTTELFYQEQRSIPFKQWLFREYYKPEFTGSEQWMLCFEIQARWHDFPLQGSYNDLLIYLQTNGACNRCQSAFKKAWADYVND